MTKREAVLAILLTGVICTVLGFVTGGIAGWRVRPPRAYVYAMQPDTLLIPMPWDSVMCAVHTAMDTTDWSR